MKGKNVPQSDSAMEVTTAITYGKGFFFFLILFSSKGWQEHEAKCYLCSWEETHMRTSVLRSCFKNNCRRGVCLHSTAGDLQSSGKWDSSGASSADSPNVSWIVYICTHCQTTPPWPQWVFCKLKEVLLPCFLPKNIDQFSVALLLDPFFLSQQLLNSTFKSLKNNPVSMNLQNMWQKNVGLGTTPSQRWGLVHQKKKGKADCQILEQDAHIQHSALAYLLLTTGTGSKPGRSVYWDALRKSITLYLLLQLPSG